MRLATAVLEEFLKSHRVVRVLERGGVTVVGLATSTGTAPDYLTFDEALDRALVDVEEVSAGGSVPECRVRNRSASRLLLVEGEEIRGAKQNRILNTSAFLEKESETVIPVSCVEKGRWRYESATFAKGSRAPSSLLYAMKSSVTRSLRSEASYRSDQWAVWNETADCLSAAGTSSPTDSLSDAYDKRRKELDDFVGRIGSLEGSTGVAVLVGDRVVACELFDRPATFSRLQERILTGVAFDVLFRNRDLPAGEVDLREASRRTESWLERLSGLAPSSHPSVGLGENLRLEEADLVGSALVVGDSVLHFGAQGR
ncbi:MAG: hypothetical protein HY720_23625 [Planctomycetes bacterium]|nr:hypothetical protein [Planctomycetota bacterium]